MNLFPSSLSATTAFALVGVVGVGAQWLAWRFRVPGIVLLLIAGLVLGPATGIFIPSRDIGDLLQPLISLAVAVILFEGGLTLSFSQLRDAAPAVRRLVVIGAPVGWLLSTLALHFVAGLTWETSAVFGGVMIVTGPTVIAPLLRMARLRSRPAQLLQWEAIVNDPVGALVAVVALEFVLVRREHLTLIDAVWAIVSGIFFAALVGAAAAWLVVWAFRRALVPEYMKVPMLFVLVLAAFAASNGMLHESGLLAVTVMGLIIANSDLPSYTEVYRFKEQATTLLLSGVFILLAANVELAMLAQVDLRMVLFIVATVLVVRPLTVAIALSGTAITRPERVLVALTAPRGVVLLAISGIFAERLMAEGVVDGAALQPLAFVLVLSTVVLHGFTLRPLADRLGLTSGAQAGVILVGGSEFTTGLAKALSEAEVQVLVTDPNRSLLRHARDAGVPTYYGDILAEAADHSVEFMAYDTMLVASDNDAYNTLVATNLGPELGRGAIWQVARVNEGRSRHTLPAQLGGQPLGSGQTLRQYRDLLAQGWRFRRTQLTDAYGVAEWRTARPDAVALATIDGTKLRFLGPEDAPTDKSGVQIISLGPPRDDDRVTARAQ